MHVSLQVVAASVLTGAWMHVCMMSRALAWIRTMKGEVSRMSGIKAQGDAIDNGAGTYAHATFSSSAEGVTLYPC